MFVYWFKISEFTVANELFGNRSVHNCSCNIILDTGLWGRHFIIIIIIKIMMKWCPAFFTNFFFFGKKAGRHFSFFFKRHGVTKKGQGAAPCKNGLGRTLTTVPPFITDGHIANIKGSDWLLQMAIVLTLTVIATIYITMTFFLWRRRGRCSSTVYLTGKTVIITGANTGNNHTPISIQMQVLFYNFL